MNNFKFTGANIAAALLILAYFFPWVDLKILSLSGFSITSNGISPGILAGAVNGLPRFFMVLAIFVPTAGVIILYQNITGNKKFDKFYKPAHVVPALYLIFGIVGLYFKMKPDTSSLDNAGMFGHMSSRMSDMAPGAFDILSLGIYLSLAAAIYLLLVSFGKIKDKEYYKPNSAPSINNNITNQE